MKISMVFITALLFSIPSAYSAKLVASTVPVSECLQFLTGRHDRQAENYLNVGQAIEMSRIREDLGKLAGSGAEPISYRPIEDRFTEANKELVRVFVVRRLQELGLEVSYERKGNVTNIIGTMQGKESPETFYEITAHYDTTGVGKPGAEDNGASVALMLELARVFKGNPPGTSIRFVFMDLEEQEFQGSRLHANILKAELEGNPELDFRGSLVVDTIGWGNPELDYWMVLEIGEEMDFPLTHQKSSGKRRKKKQVPMVSESSCRAGFEQTMDCAEQIAYQYLRYADENGYRPDFKLRLDTWEAKGSTADHGSYWNAGLPAVLFAARFERGYVNPYYHKFGDTVDNMNWEYFERTARFVTESLARLVGVSESFESTQERRPQNTALDASQNLIQRLVGKRHVPSDQPSSSTSQPSGSSSSGTSTSGLTTIQMTHETVKDPLELVLTGKPSEFFVVFENNLKALDVVSKSGSAYLTNARAGDIEKIKKALDQKGMEYFVVRSTGVATHAHHNLIRIYVWGEGKWGGEVEDLFERRRGTAAK